MVVVPSLRARLRIASRPHRNVQGVDRGIAVVSVSKGVPREQSPQTSFVHAPHTKCGVEAAPAAPMDGRQAQVRWRGDGARGEQRVRKLEEGIGSAIQAPVERAPEGAWRLGQGLHGDPSCSCWSPMSTADADVRPFGLKDKLSARGSRLLSSGVAPNRALLFYALPTPRVTGNPRYSSAQTLAGPRQRFLLLEVALPGPTGHRHGEH